MIEQVQSHLKPVSVPGYHLVLTQVYRIMQLCFCLGTSLGKSVRSIQCLIAFAREKSLSLMSNDLTECFIVTKLETHINMLNILKSSNWEENCI